MTLNRDAIIGLIVLGIILIGVFWYAATHPAPVAETPDVVTPGQTQPLEPAVIQEQSDFYSVDAKYPSVTVLAETAGPAADAAAVLAIRSFEENQIAAFKENVNGYDAEFRQHIIDQGWKVSIQMDYMAFASPATVTYIVGIFEDTLGAHPNTYYRTFTFDLASGEPLEIHDLFDANANYLNTLSQLSRDRLPAMIAEREQVTVDEIDTAMLEAGTTANEENFQTFYLDGPNFVLLFPPYQIGPYVLGAVELRIPTKEIQGFKAEYVS